jgi:hypothetical protein
MIPIRFSSSSLKSTFFLIIVVLIFFLPYTRGSNIDTDGSETDWFGGNDPDNLPTATKHQMCQACAMSTIQLHQRSPILKLDVGKLSPQKRFEREEFAFSVTEIGFCAEVSFISYDVHHATAGKWCKDFLDRYNEDQQVEERLAKGVPGGDGFDLKELVCKDVCKNIPEREHFPKKMDPYKKDSEWQAAEGSLGEGGGGKGSTADLGGWKIRGNGDEDEDDDL